MADMPRPCQGDRQPSLSAASRPVIQKSLPRFLCVRATVACIHLVKELHIDLSNDLHKLSNSAMWPFQMNTFGCE